MDRASRFVYSYLYYRSLRYNLITIYENDIAPGGQLYWYNQQSKISTYTRPIISQVPPPPPAGFAGIPPPPVGFTAPANTQPPAQFAAPIHFSLTSSNPPVLQPPSQALPVPKEKKEKKEKPLTKTPIEGTEWTRVITTKGNTFYTNRETKESVWTVPGEIRELLDALERSEKVEVEEVKIEIETGTGAKRKASGELEEEVKVAGEEVKIEIEEEVKTAAEPPAKRKRGHKPKLVHSIADLGQNELNEIKAATDLAKVEASTAIAEQDDVPDDSDANEEWQRELLNQMAKEEGAKESISPVPIKSRLPPSLPAIPLPQVSPEEAVAGFKVNSLFSSLAITR
jgi:transcription elongation regulator 1